MSEVLLPLALLACPLTMGLMMWFMMRGGKDSLEPSPPADNDAELAELRAQVDQLRAAQREAADTTVEPPATADGFR
ncbi:hypothetical protein PV772_15090 [Pseudarthrobacter sp. CC12]|uniref:hypothetical protein n=1 Tax=unclassified Pseudarthrobacter TaxID=2647000 RepID=UPI00112FD822|nr:hypothetical protein [Pseudarthrobacter sp. NIBRBAC000502771]QDG63791.1 hypothetical protein NIBR502771_16685 [Pseudarthrobacter sp. NIBRBAC000502771]